VTRVDRSEIRPHPHSFGDPDGQLFRYGDDLYRGLRGQRARFFESLFAAGVIEQLGERGLIVGTEVAPLDVDGYDVIVRHHTIEHVAYPTEWCAPMFADAALLYLDLLEELARNDLTLKDVHPWNLVFDGWKPVFVDLTSIAPAEERRPDAVAARYRRYYLMPLLLMSAGHGALARSLMLEYGGVSEDDVRRLVGRRRWRAARGGKTWADVIAELRREIADASPPRPAPLGDASALSADLVTSVADSIGTQSLLIFNSSARAAGLLAAQGRRVVTASDDEALAADVYRVASAERSPVLSVLLDFTKPTPSVGYSGGHFSIAATERLACELVVAHDLVPRVVGHRSLTFEHVSEGLALFARRAALVAFAPLAQEMETPAWYRANRLGDALAERFANVRSVSSADETTWYLCEK
jgi:hypothetical protein